MDITCQRTITADGREILYSLERKQVKNLNLRVRKDGSVWVSADPGVPCEEIDAFVAGKAPYILKALNHFHEMAQYRPQPKQYVSGETFNILGRGLRLRVTQAARIPFQRTASIFIWAFGISLIQKRSGVSSADSWISSAERYLAT